MKNKNSISSLKKNIFKNFKFLFFFIKNFFKPKIEFLFFIVLFLYLSILSIPKDIFFIVLI
jgi:hypothetical protein